MDCIQLIKKKLNELYDEKAIPEKTHKVMEAFIESYVKTAKQSQTPDEEVIQFFSTYVERLRYLHHHPFSFEPFHKQILEPFNYFTFGLQFVRPLVNLAISCLEGWDQVQAIEEAVSKGENVVLLANHQTEVDPQLINLLLEERYPKLGQDMIFVAGDRVILDHLAVPASMGRNLLCIYSKKHISNPPSQMAQKRHHNQRTMERMSDLLKEGGKCIYVAPSGGRDRPDEKGHFPVAPLDPQSIELFYLMAKKSKVPCHFHSLALLTHRVLPPPNDVEIELGEDRSTSYSGIYASFGQEIDMENFSGSFIENKIERRHARSDFVWQQIHDNYQNLKKIQDQHETTH